MRFPVTLDLFITRNGRRRRRSQKRGPVHSAAEIVGLLSGRSISALDHEESHSLWLFDSNMLIYIFDE